MTPTRKPEGEGWKWGQYRVKGVLVWAWMRRRNKSTEGGSMTLPLDPHEIIRGHDLGDAMDSIWANALRAPRHSAKPEPRVSPRLGPSGECRLSQETFNERLAH